MRLFAIDTDNTITAFPAAEQIPEGQEHFATEKELAKLAANWPADRLVQVWNSFAGVAGFGGDLKPVKKFTDRKSAVARIWKAIQKLDAPAAPKAAKGAPKKTKATKAARTKGGAPAAREGSKKALVLELLRRKDGATLAEIAKATEWQNHSIRGFISGSLSKKMGLKIESIKREDGERRYVLAQ
jgi:transposase